MLIGQKSVWLKVVVKYNDAHTSEEDKESRGEDNAPCQHACVVVSMPTGDKRKVRHPPLHTTVTDCPSSREVLSLPDGF